MDGWMDGANLYKLLLIPFSFNSTRRTNYQHDARIDIIGSRSNPKTELNRY